MLDHHQDQPAHRKGIDPKTVLEPTVATRRDHAPAGRRLAVRLATIGAVVVVLLALPAIALAGGTTRGADRAVIRAVAKEGDTVYWYGSNAQVKCRRTGGERFGCKYMTFRRISGGGEAMGNHWRVTVTYSRGRYSLGKPHAEPV